MGRGVGVRKPNASVKKKKKKLKTKTSNRPRDAEAGAPSGGHSEPSRLRPTRVGAWGQARGEEGQLSPGGRQPGNRNEHKAQTDSGSLRT